MRPPYLAPAPQPTLPTDRARRCDEGLPDPSPTPRINKAVWRALDLTRAYAARDRAAIIEHLEPDHLAHTRGHPLSDA
ncbi:hypothetical protein OG828_08835 [Streptomyces sp. NBC_00457]|uniref:hypothetical protein n=1 Tax=Streptomyces sp. NBC_00457 TaxID=2975748 RepID=UPI002E20408D